MIEFYEFQGHRTLKFSTIGFAAEHIHSTALKLCQGKGFDIGCGKKEWVLPGAFGVDPITFESEYHAMNLPVLNEEVDYIFSSHCLEHLENPWPDVLNYWGSKIKKGGNIFLYLPHYASRYHRPWNNRKHKHVLTAEIIVDYLEASGWIHIFSTGIDLNDSFSVVAEKGPNT